MFYNVIDEKLGASRNLAVCMRIEHGKRIKGYNYVNKRIMTMKFKYEIRYSIIIGVGLYAREE